MSALRIVLLVAGPIFLFFTISLLRFWNNGLGQWRKKRWALITAIVTLIFSILSVILYFKIPKPNEINIDLDRIETAQELEEAISYFDEFLKIKSEELGRIEKEVENLKAEHNELEPIVELEREDFETVLEAFDIWNRKRIWYEYLVTFVFGVLATLVGALIIRKPSQGFDKKELRQNMAEFQGEQERLKKYFK